MDAPFPLPPFNPFADVAVGNPWKSSEPDVGTINSEAYNALLGLVKQIGATPNLAALVLGMAGGGKTHLIKRLIFAHDVEAVFVYVHPLKDHNRIFTSLMEQVAQPGSPTAVANRRRSCESIGSGRSQRRRRRVRTLSGRTSGRPRENLSRRSRNLL